MTNIGIVSIAYGDYFERYGQQWINTLEEADCKQVILVSDTRVSVPSFVKLIVKECDSMALYFRTGHEFLETAWVFNLGLDDLLLPGALDPIESDADVYGWPAEYRGLRSGSATYGGGFENMPNLDWNPMVGGWAYRSDLLREIPFRDYLYFDEVHFCELSYFGKTIEYSTRPRSTWLRHEGAHSMYANRQASEEVRQFRARLRAGLIEKGVPE